MLSWNSHEEIPQAQGKRNPSKMVGVARRHQMADTEIRLITFFAAKDEEAIYSQQKQDWEMIVAQIMNSLLPNSDSN